MTQSRHNAQPSRRWRRVLQFNLATLLVAMSLVAVAMYWLSLPTIHARRYAAAMARRDFQAANRLFADRSEAFPGDWPQQHEIFNAGVHLDPCNMDDVLTGHRRITIAVIYGDSTGGIANCGVDLRAKPGGLELLQMVP